VSETQSLIRKAVQVRLELAEHARQRYAYTATAGTQVADILQTEYWAGLNPMPQPWDIIEVREELGAWWAELLVRSSTEDGIVVAGIKAVELESVAPRNFQPTNLEGCQVVYRGPFLKWCVVRPDGLQLQGGFEDEKRAAHWLTDHLRVVKTT
jgi:hypothetical protein